MKALICDICGGKLVIEKGGNHAVCESCGMHHSRDRVLEKVQEIRGTVKIKGAVETYSGNAQKEKQIKDAEALLRLKEFDRAEKVFLKLSEAYPDDPRAWWGLFRLPLEKWTPHETESLWHTTKLFHYDEPYENCVKYLKNVYALSDDHCKYTDWFKSFLDTRYGKKVRTTSIDREGSNQSVWCNGYKIKNCVPDHLSRWLLSWRGYEALEIMDDDEIFQRIIVINEDFEEKVRSGRIIWDENAPLDEYPALEDISSEASSVTSALGSKGLATLLNRNYPFEDYNKYIQNQKHFKISLIRAFCNQLYVRVSVSFRDFTPMRDELRTVKLSDPLTVDFARKLRGVCRHCGGEFSGFFTYRCSRCGNKKDY